MSANFFIKLLCLHVLLLPAASAIGQDFGWARRYELIGGSYKPFIEKDASSLVLGGTVGGTLQLDTITLSTSGVWGFIAGLDPTGGARWMKPFRSNSVDHLYSMTTDLNGNIIAGGYYDGDLIIDSTLIEVDQILYNQFGCSPCFFGSDGYLASVDRDGRTNWIKGVIGLNNQAVYKIKTDSENNVIAGMVVSYKFLVDNQMFVTKDVSPYLDRPYAFVFKFTQEGKLLWHYECHEISLVDEIIVDSDDNIYLLKEINSGASGIVKLNPDGEEIYDVEISDYKVYLDRGIVDQDDNLILAGLRVLDSQEFVTLLIKISSDGKKILWKKEYHGMMDMNAMEADSKGNIYIGGSVSTDPPLSFMDIEINGAFRYIYAKFSCSGDLEWFVNLKDQNIGIIGDLVCEADDLYLCGYTFPSESGFAIGDSLFAGDPNMLFLASFSESSSLPCNDTSTVNMDCDFVLVDLNAGTTDIADLQASAGNFIIHPTIVNETFNVSIRQPYETGKITVRVLSLSGSVLQQEEFMPSDLIMVRCPQLPPGFYLVTVSGTGTRTEASRIVVPF